MKNYISIILISIALFSCNNVKKASFTGEVTNFNNDDFFFVKSITQNPDSIDVIDGKFYKEIYTEKAKIKSLMIGNNYTKVFLSPSKSLEIYCDISNLDSSLVFSGDLMEENKVLYQIENEPRNINYRHIFFSQIDISLQYLDSIHDSINELFKNLTDKKQMDSDFLFLAENMIKYEIENLKFYVGFQQNLYRDSLFHQMIDNNFIEDENLIDLNYYQSYVMYYTAFKARTLLANQNRDEKMSYTDANLKSIELLNNKHIKDYVLYDLFKMILIRESIEEFEKYSSYFYENIHNQEFIDDINIKYVNKKLLARGNYAPNFTYLDIDSTEVSLSDYRGKYVYIDFWSIGCGGCRNDLPHLKKLQEEYKDENIVFVSVSMDDNWEDWEQVVKSEMGRGVALNAGGGYNEGVFKDYQIQSIPTYVFVDKEGKLIESRAPRPSTQEVRALFDEYVK